MPKTKSEKIIFTGLMVFFMVYSMTVYNISLKSGGLSYMAFTLAIKEMWIEYVVVFVLIYFLINGAALKTALKLFTPGEDKQILFTLAVQSSTVCMIVPVITLFATLIHNGFTSQWFVEWIQLWAMCFPVALFLQLFYIGPLVRSIFRLIQSKMKAGIQIENKNCNS